MNVFVIQLNVCDVIQYNVSMVIYLMQAGLESRTLLMHHLCTHYIEALYSLTVLVATITASLPSPVKIMIGDGRSRFCAMHAILSPVDRLY